MSSKKRRQNDQIIRDPKDPRIACYSQANYNIRDIKSKALAWFIQLAIRGELLVASRITSWDRLDVNLDGYPFLLSKVPDLRKLIREKHIIDEPVLAEIGMSLYDFPALARFFDRSTERTFVREATIRELRDTASQARSVVRESRLSEMVPEDEDEGEITDTGIDVVFGEFTSTNIRRHAEIPEERIPKGRLFYVDTAAPVEVLTEQFRFCLERTSKKKSRFELMACDLEEYGVLPYMDIRIWQYFNFGPKITLPTIASLIYRNSAYGERKIDETTGPKLDSITNPSGPAIRAMQATAALEFDRTVQSVLDGNDATGDSAPAEALLRWLPATYPHNIRWYDRFHRVFPEAIPGLDNWIDLNDPSVAEDLKLSLTERIRGHHSGDPTGEAIKAMLMIGDEFKSQYGTDGPGLLLDFEEMANDGAN